MNYIEDSSLLKLRFSNGMLLLPFFRWSIMQYINRPVNNQKSTEKCNEGKSHSWIKPFLKNLGHCTFSKKDILFFTTTLFNVKDNEGRWLNQLDGYYYSLFPDKCLLFENATGLFQWRKNDDCKNRSFLHSYVLHVSFLLARLSLKIRSKHNDDLRLLAEKFPDIFNLPALRIIDRQVSIYSVIIKNLLRYCSPKLIFVNCACYGGMDAILIKRAKELGIRTVELQHGVIENEHSAYCENVFNGSMQYAEYLPDEIWTFGDYWSSKIKWNIVVKSVGNPHILRYMTKNRLLDKKYDYFIVSQFTINDEIIDVAGDLSKLYPESRICIRLHPADDASVYSRLVENHPNVVLSDSKVNLYDDLCASNVVIGGYSTCLYEALAFGINPYIIDCELSRRYLNPEIGIWIKSASEIVTKNAEMGNLDLETIWKHDFDKNARNLIQEIIC